MQLFLSHASSDKAVALILRNLIEQCSIRRATVWYSSDTSTSGGISPGTPWFDQVLKNIESSAAFLALITPNSQNNLWVQYEAGFGAASKLPIIPLVAGLSANDIKPPLSFFNAYNIVQPDQLKSVLLHLFEHHNIPHEETLFDAPVKDAARRISQKISNSTDEPQGIGLRNDEDILRHIDRRFLELIDRFSGTDQYRGSVFALSANVTRGGKILDRISIDVSEDATLGDVSHALYFRIEKHVQAYTYLKQWIVRDNTLGVHLVMREFLDHVRASAIVKPDHEYEIILLDRPYDLSASNAANFY